MKESIKSEKFYNVGEYHLRLYYTTFGLSFKCISCQTEIKCRECYLRISRNKVMSRLCMTCEGKYKLWSDDEKERKANLALLKMKDIL